MEEMLQHLARAYGGHSQYSTADVGRAIARCMNNQGLAGGLRGDPSGPAQEAAALLAERWEGQGNSEAQDAAEIEVAAREQLARFAAVRPTYSPGAGY